MGKKGFSNVKQYNDNKQPKMDELVAMLDLHKTGKKYIKLRFLDTDKYGRPAIANIWVEKEIEKNNKTVSIRFPRLPYSWDPINDEFKDTKNRDPYLKAEAGQFQKHYYVNVLVRPLQEKKRYSGKPSKSEAKTGFCDDLESKDKTPVRVIRLPTTVVVKRGSLS